jgi:hypothetical protein
MYVARGREMREKDCCSYADETSAQIFSLPGEPTFVLLARSQSTTKLRKHWAAVAHLDSPEGEDPALGRSSRKEVSAVTCACALYNAYYTAHCAVDSTNSNKDDETARVASTRNKHCIV